MDKTIAAHLKLTDEQAQVFKRTLGAYTACFNIMANLALRRSVAMTTNIRKAGKTGCGKQNKSVSTRRRFHHWSFAQLHRFTSYKAATHDYL